MQQCLDADVNFVVIAGDLFEKRSVEPTALLQAQEGLRLLKRRNIPVIAIEGNHDRALYREGMSWMQYLEESGYLALLDPLVGQEATYRPHKRGEGGSYFDCCGARIAGQGFAGAATPHVLDDMAAHLRLSGRGDNAYLIYLCHAGLEGVVPHASGCLADKGWNGLLPCVDYLALGHIHQRYERDNRMFNPGSLEARDSVEAGRERGFYIVDVDTDTPQKHSAMHCKARQRPWLLLNVSADDANSPDALAAKVRVAAETCERNAENSDAPLADLRITGSLNFDTSCLKMADLETIVRDVCAPLHVVAHNHTRRPDTELGTEEAETLDRMEITRRVFTAHFAQQPFAREQAEDWAKLTVEIQQMALDATFTPDQIMAAVRDRAPRPVPQPA